jgi:hypothetical protein
MSTGKDSPKTRFYNIAASVVALFAGLACGIIEVSAGSRSGVVLWLGAVMLLMVVALSVITGIHAVLALVLDRKLRTAR